MVTGFIILFSLLAAGAAALAVRAVFRALRWMVRFVRILLGLSLLSATALYYYPRLFSDAQALFSRLKNRFSGAEE